MEIKIFKVGKEKPEEMEIRCHEVTEEVREIVAFVKTRQGRLTGLQEGRQFEVPVRDVCYVEAVDNKVFLYTQKQVYETRQKLYELEELLREKYFLRVSKSMLLNLMKVQSVKPAMNGRMLAVLRGGEEIMITRKYVSELKRALKEG
jgi:DNA-binding LytR/AlgR family response regulator